MKIREYLIKQDENGAFHLFHIGDEVVRCKDCKWWEGCNNVQDYIGGFCSDGERREEWQED